MKIKGFSRDPLERAVVRTHHVRYWCVSCYGSYRLSLFRLLIWIGRPVVLVHHTQTRSSSFDSTLGSVGGWQGCGAGIPPLLGHRMRNVCRCDDGGSPGTFLQRSSYVKHEYEAGCWGGGCVYSYIEGSTVRETLQRKYSGGVGKDVLQKQRYFWHYYYGTASKNINVITKK